MHPSDRDGIVAADHAHLRKITLISPAYHTQHIEFRPINELR